MAVNEYFAHSYSEARTKFLATARAAGSRLAQYVLPNIRGPNDEDLIVDVALLGAQDPRNLLVLISGTHGVEGFCGSGCQIGYLADQLYEALSSTTGLLLVHALNPFGFAWLRRVNEDNIDLIAIFMTFPNRFPGQTVTRRSIIC